MMMMMFYRRRALIERTISKALRRKAERDMLRPRSKDKD